MNAPKIPTETLIPQSFTTITQAEDQLLAQVAMKQETIVEQHLEHPLIDQSTLTGMVFMGDTFSRFEVTDTIFHNCTLVNCDFDGISLFRVRFENCKLVGTTLDYGTLKEVTFVDCDLSLTNFNEAKLTQVAFQRSKLTELNCLGSTLKQCRFDDCNLDQADFSETSLKHHDLSSCRFDTLQVSDWAVRGCRFNETQAAYLARLFLGITLA